MVNGRNTTSTIATEKHIPSNRPGTWDGVGDGACVGDGVQIGLAVGAGVVASAGVYVGLVVVARATVPTGVCLAVGVEVAFSLAGGRVRVKAGMEVVVRLLRNTPRSVRLSQEVKPSGRGLKC
jgi:hypothetical protein